jgi:hypothetical protein
MGSEDTVQEYIKSACVYRVIAPCIDRDAASCQAVLVPVLDLPTLFQGCVVRIQGPEPSGFELFPLQVVKLGRR